MKMSIVPERKLDGNIMKDKEIHGEGNVWTTAQRQKETKGFDVVVGFDLNHRSVGYGKQCSLIWSYVRERGSSSLDKGIRFLG